MSIHVAEASDVNTFGKRRTNLIYAVESKSISQFRLFKTVVDAKFIMFYSLC